MWKLLPIALVITVMIGALIYIRFFRQSENTDPSTQVSSLLKSSSPNSSDFEGRIKSLEESVTLLATQVTKQAQNSNISTTNQTSKSSSNIESRVESLENTIAGLQRQVSQLNTQTVQTTTTKVPVYIPLGWSGSAVTTDWSSITGQDIIIKPSDYPGYTSMQFEANIRTYQGNGKAFARLINNTDGLAVLSSEISSTSQDYNWVTSATFTLNSSQKTYRLQLKSLTGYEASIQNARIKVNF